MASPLILVGTDYTLYRDVFTGALRALRPDFAVREVLPEEIDTAVRSERPWLVICSTVVRAIEEVAQAWIVLPAGGDEAAEVGVQGLRQAVPSPTFDELLTMIDELWLELASGWAASPG